MAETIEDTCIGHVGRHRTTSDAMSPGPARELEALLDREPSLADGDALPPTWHWAYLGEEVRQSDLGADGHERLGRFLPPVPFPRRMWAAGAVAVFAPLRVGRPAQRVSTIRDVAFKEGRSGKLCFVVVRHDIDQSGTLCLSEDQTLVYREPGPAAAHSGANKQAPEGFATHPPTQLMRYSAVTRNPHRIHYDRDFCREVEGYPALVVHGPLLATHLCDALRATGTSPPRHFAFRANAPVFETTPVRVETDGEAGTAELRLADGRTAMTGRMSWPD